ncbi:quinoprotein relay system zinc metallohydrolase 2 [Roseibium sp.]|uniref:quinoprotein relay system zinc metallohydrolase 2 n=1 Tax=Roseibium sp. TaxID=1936156 RepID=UPI003A970EC9
MPDFALRPVGPGVYVHEGAVEEPTTGNRGDIANLGVVIGSKAIAVIDAGGSRSVGEALLRAIRRVSDLPITHVILTHMHPDHILGASVFADTGAQVVGHASLRQAILDRKDSYLAGYGGLIGASEFLGTSVVVPDPGVAPTAIDLGARVLQLQAWPTAHSPSDLTVFDEVSGTFFAGDLVFDRHIPVIDGSLKGWLASLEVLLEMNISQLIPGHGGPVVTDLAQGLSPVRTYLEAVRDETRSALNQGQRLGDAAASVGRSQAGNWELFEAFNSRNATAAYTELEWE